MIVQRLRPGDEAVVERLATRPPQTALLGDERTIFLAALDGVTPLGFVLAYELPRRHGDPSILFVYEIEVAAGCRRQGVATRLLSELERIARTRGVRTGFVLTSAADEPAMRLYESLGGVRQHDDDVMWDFEYGDS